ncbi:hypothetical protein J6590_018121 [Homalodisca vitripennis]|nr:hypothetical protein J6590_018121 [Homalodisca vitripennis]
MTRKVIRQSFISAVHMYYTGSHLSLSLLSSLAQSIQRRSANKRCRTIDRGVPRKVGGKLTDCRPPRAAHARHARRQQVGGLEAPVKLDLARSRLCM